MTGFIRVDRALMDHHLVGVETDGFKPWMWMLMSAAWKARKVRVAGRTIELQPGELCYSTRYLAKAWDRSEAWVRRFLAALRDDGMIRRSSDAGVTHLTLCNWCKYQSSDRGSDAGATQERRKYKQGNKYISFTSFRRYSARGRRSGSKSMERDGVEDGDSRSSGDQRQARRDVGGAGPGTRGRDGSGRH